jgi:kinesin family protein 1
LSKNSFLNFEPSISKSRSMESLVTLNNTIEEEDESGPSGNNLSVNRGGQVSASAAAAARNANNLRRRRHLSPTSIRAKYIAEIEEVRINPIVSKKGFLNFLEEKSIGWSKRFVVSDIFLLFVKPRF